MMKEVLTYRYCINCGHREDMHRLEKNRRGSLCDWTDEYMTIPHGVHKIPPIIEHWHELICYCMEFVPLVKKVRK